MPYSMQDFAALIKQKYPDYANVPDDELVSRVVAKHPEYKSQVTLDPRSEIAFRKENPPAAAHGDPNAGGMSLLDVGGAIGKGLAHFVGIPTSMDELKGTTVDNVLNMATGGALGAAKNAVGMFRDAMGGHVPVIGRPVEALLAPSVAVAHGNAPTVGENLGAIEAGTQLGATAAAAHPAVRAAIGRATERLGGALDSSARRGMASVVDPAGTNPQREAIGDQLRRRSVRMSNPREDMARLAAEQGAPLSTASPLLDAQGNQVRKTLTPEQEIWNATLDAAKDAQARQPIMSGAKGRALSEVVLGTAAKVLGVPHSVIAAVLGGSEVLGIARKVMTSPLWKTTSAVIKTDMANALRSGDMASALSIGAKVIGGVGLEDQYGHDQAVHDVVRTAVEQAQGNPQVARQILANKEATYVNPDGSEVPIPFSVTRAFFNLIGLSNINQPLAQRDAQGGQDQAGRQVGVPAGTEITHDFAGHATGPAPDELRNYRSGWGPITPAYHDNETALGREWPAAANLRDENAAMLDGKVPSGFLPPKFVHAKQTRWGSPITGRIEDQAGVPPSNIPMRGLTGLELDPAARAHQTAPANAIMIAKGAPLASYTHEQGHTAWLFDLSDADRSKFRAQFDGIVKSFVSEAQSSLQNIQPAERKAALSAIAQRYPQAIVRYFAEYRGDPERAYNEAFAETFGQYMLNPHAMKRDHPDVYQTMRDIIGVEYEQSPMKRHVPSGAEANKPAWEYPGGMK